MKTMSPTQRGDGIYMNMVMFLKYLSQFYLING